MKELFYVLYDGITQMLKENEEDEEEEYGDGDDEEKEFRLR
ncbi:MAG: hypothetical protein EZS28_045243, partial [Streblomastix strix]